MSERAEAGYHLCQCQCQWESPLEKIITHLCWHALKVKESSCFPWANKSNYTGICEWNIPIIHNNNSVNHLVYVKKTDKIKVMSCSFSMNTHLIAGWWHSGECGLCSTIVSPMHSVFHVNKHLRSVWPLWLLCVFDESMVTHSSRLTARHKNTEIN